MYQKLTFKIDMICFRQKILEIQISTLNRLDFTCLVKSSDKCIAPITSI